MSKLSNIHVHTVDPKEAWREGLGWLARLRVILSFISIDLILAIASYIQLDWQISLAILGVGVGVACPILIYRKTLLATADLGIRLHDVCHNLRDDVGAILQLAGERKPAEYMERFKRFHDDTADRLALFFRELVEEKTVNCAIRLAETQGGKEYYRTVGRSNGMDPSRKERSVPIPSDAGLASKLRLEGKMGVCFIHDIEEAKNVDWWFSTPTDDLEDVKTLVIAPINGFELGQKKMLGMLYVTSRTDCFRKIHAEPLKAFADLLGAFYPLIAGLFGESIVQSPEERISHGQG